MVWLTKDQLVNNYSKHNNKMTMSGTNNGMLPQCVVYFTRA